MRIAKSWGRKGREIAILLAIGTFLAFVSPFGSTSGVAFWRGWLFWTGLTVGGAQIGEFIAALIMARLAGWPALIGIAAVALVMGIIMTPLVAGAAILLGGVIPLARWPGLFAGVTVISAFLTGIGFLMQLAFTRDPPAPAAPDAGAIRARFLQRLPHRLRRARLIAIASEDHYLRVHTDAGSELILMRLADAVRELDGAGGVQTHRSWWVAGDAVTGRRRENGRLILMLEGGLDVPVSRSFAAGAKAAGLT